MKKKLYFILFVFMVFFALILIALPVKAQNGAVDAARAKIKTAVENAKKYESYLFDSGANNYELAKNHQFIQTAERCLQQELKESCYNSVRDEINRNDYYSGKLPVPGEDKK